MITQNVCKLICHRLLLSMSATFLIFFAPATRAEVTDANPAGFLVSLHQEVKANPNQLFLAIGQVGKWWNPRHTMSGSAANLSLNLAAGGCFCEDWNENSAQHAQVILVVKDSLIRMQGSLGPLQEMAVNGVLTFAIEAKDGKTVLKTSYRVNGGAQSGLDQLAPAVDGVLAEQMHRLVAYVETGAAN